MLCGGWGQEANKWEKSECSQYDVNNQRNNYDMITSSPCWQAAEGKFSVVAPLKSYQRGHGLLLAWMGNLALPCPRGRDCMKFFYFWERFEREVEPESLGSLSLSTVTLGKLGHLCASVFSHGKMRLTFVFQGLWWGLAALHLKRCLQMWQGNSKFLIFILILNKVFLTIRFLPSQVLRAVLMVSAHFCVYRYLQIFSTYVNVWALTSREMELLVTSVCLILSRELGRLSARKPS